MRFHVTQKRVEVSDHGGPVGVFRRSFYWCSCTCELRKLSGGEQSRVAGRRGLAGRWPRGAAPGKGGPARPLRESKQGGGKRTGSALKAELEARQRRLRGEAGARARRARPSEEGRVGLAAREGGGEKRAPRRRAQSPGRQGGLSRGGRARASRLGEAARRGSSAPRGRGAAARALQSAKQRCSAAAPPPRAACVGGAPRPLQPGVALVARRGGVSATAKEVVR